MKKLISILIPCYNEVENVEPLSKEIVLEMENNLPMYDYEIVFIDNFSFDGTREKLEEMCRINNKIKAIFNCKNFGACNSAFHALQQTHGECTILMCADFQEPVCMIHKMVHEWEKGCKIVALIKTHSEENTVVRFIRTCYYKLIKKMSSVEQIEHFTGDGLYDKSFIDVLRNLDDPTPFLRGIVAELGAKRKDLEYTQAKRRAGQSHYNWYSLYDVAMLSFTSYTKVGLRVATLLGFLFALITMLIAVVYFIAKIMWWDSFPMGTAPMLIGMFFLGSIQLFFIGLLGEYILNINARIMHRPLVVEEKRINF